MTEFAGMTRTDCVKDCNAARCLISGKAYCAHPDKGVPQGADAKNAEVVARYQRARTALGLNPPLDLEVTA